MPFNHYAKLREILKKEKPGWYIKKIKTPTSTKNFKGETVTYPHYFRIYAKDGTPIKYGKFQQLDRLASILSTTVSHLPIVK